MSQIVIKQIDFLPDKFRNAVRRRRASYWRFVVVLLFVGVFATAAWGMHSVRRNVRRDYEQTALRHTAAQAQETMLKNREARLAELRAYADLVTFLRHPWPRSQLLERLFAPLPETVIIDKLHLVNELKPVVAGSATPVEATGENAPAKTATTDLVDLRKAVETNDLIIHLEGTTVDQPGLHAYLHRLADDKLFRRAQVESIEAAREDGAEAGVAKKGASRFTARIVVCPGWGLTDGPTEEELTAAAEVITEESTFSDEVETPGDLP
jgi:Tfp pilus assembly protein PilN